MTDLEKITMLREALKPFVEAWMVGTRKDISEVHALLGPDVFWNAADAFSESEGVSQRPDWVQNAHGIWEADMDWVTRGNKKDIVGPHGQIIPNADLEAVYEGEGIERRVCGWRASSVVLDEFIQDEVFIRFCEQPLPMKIVRE